MLATAPLCQAMETDFFAAAHPDDWQLFMNPTTYNKVQNHANKIVFIHASAGDAGTFADPYSMSPYYLAREEGSLRSIRFVENADGQGRGLHIKSSVTINNHNLVRYTYGNTVAYFLRLPDGNFSGSGYGSKNGFPYSNESLYRLMTNQISSIHAVDNSTVYKGWSDLTTTLSMIVDYEGTGSSKITFNIHDTDTNLNPGDHYDHLDTSLAMQDVAAQKSCVDLNMYLGYTTMNKPVNLSQNELITDAATWGVTTSGLSDKSRSSTWPSHNVWLGKNYFRTVTAGTACVDKPNLAFSAAATASSENIATGQTAQKAIDGVTNGYPVDYTKEWVSSGGKAGVSLKLTWNSTVSISKVVLYDRPNLNDQITAARLIFDNGISISVPTLTNNGSGDAISFPTVNAKTATLQIDGVSSKTLNVGLSEIQFY